MSNVEALEALLEQARTQLEAKPAEDRHVARFAQRRAKQATAATKKAVPTASLPDESLELLRNGTDAITPEDFILDYIADPANRTYTRKDKDTGRVLEQTVVAGCHVVYSGLMRDFAQMYPDLGNAGFIKVTDQMAADGLLIKKPVKGGYWLIPIELAMDGTPKAKETKVSPALAALLARFAKGE